MTVIPTQQNPDPVPEPPGANGMPEDGRPAPPTGTVEVETIETTGGIEATDWWDGITRSHFSAWRVPVGERLLWLQAELDDRGSGPPAGVRAAMRIAYESALTPSSLATWYSGAHIERAWRALHLAEARVIAHSPDLAGRLPALRERVLEDLDPKDHRAKAILAIKPDNIGPSERAQVAEALRAAYTTSDNSHTAVRGLRNRLVLFGLLMLCLNLTLGVLSALSPTLLPLCVQSFCPTGRSAPSGGDVWLVQLLGAFGGAVAVVILLLRSRPSVVAYTLTPYQAGIKVMLGAVLAVIGVLIATTGVLQGIVAARPALLVLAVVLGYAQQVGTRLLDSYANDLVGKAQPKTADGN